MPIKYRRNLAVFTDVVTVEEAEPLLAWAQQKREPRADLGDCSHLHPANLQVLMASRTQVTAWPADAHLSQMLQTVLRSQGD
jgi:hypothetical protein